MRVELFELRFNNGNNSRIFVSGQPVAGSVVIKLNKATFIDSIYIKFSGRAKCKWDVPNGDSSKRYKATETYIDSEFCLYKCQNEDEKHPVGMHVYPFDFTLPTDVPSSFEGRRGYIRYNCFVVMDRGWKGALTIEQDLTVIRHLHLSQLPEACMPVNIEGEEMYEGCCCDSGNVEACMRLQKSGFVPGEPMYFDVIINNHATSSIGGWTIALIQTVRYTGFSDSLFSSGHPKYHDKVNNWILFQCEEEIGAGKSSVLTNYCPIPAVATSMLEGCALIDIEYEVQLEVPVGWKTVQLSRRVFVGTIPLRRHNPQPQPPSSEHTISTESDLNSPPTRQNYELPPSYEECVFGRMESQEGENDDNLSDDNDPSRASASSRRHQLHRLPSYPYYSASQFINGTGGATSVNQPINSDVQRNPSAAGYSAISTFDPTAHPGDRSNIALNSNLPTGESTATTSYSSLPPPPSYDSLHH